MPGHLKLRLTKKTTGG